MTDEKMDARLRAAGERWRGTDGGQAPAGLDEPVDLLPGPRTLIPVRRRRSFVAIASAAAVVAALAVGIPLAVRGHGGSASDRGQDTTPLQGTVWRLTNYGSGDPDFQSTATLSIDKSGNLVADDRCTLIGGKVDVSGSSISTSDQIVRYRTCAVQRGVKLSTGIATLRGTARYALDGSSLTIGSGGSAMHLDALPSSVPPPTLDVPTFVGAHWTLSKAVDASGANAPISATTLLKLHIDDNGTYTASPGCYSIQGDVATTGDTATFVRGALSAGVGDMPCAEQGKDGAKASDVVYATLSGSVTESVTGNVLTITKRGVGTLYYSWVPEDPSTVDPQNLVGKQWHLVNIDGSSYSGSASLYFYPNELATVDNGNGCSNPANPSVSSGSFTLSSIIVSGPARPACQPRTSATAATIEGFLSAHPVLWTVRDGKLILHGDGAQSDALIYSTTPTGPAPSPTTTVTSPLLGTRWILKSYSDHASDRIVPHESNGTVSLEFDNGFAQIAQPCPVYDSTIAISGGSVHFDAWQFLATGCPLIGSRAPDTVGENDMLRNLIGSVAWSIDGTTLTLTAGSETFTFDRATSSNTDSPAPTSSSVSSPLVGTTWNLVEIDTPSTATDKVGRIRRASAGIALTLRPGGLLVAVPNPCEVRRSWRLSGHRIVGTAIPDVATSCMPLGFPSAQAGADAGTFDTMLAGTVSWSISNAQLHLTKGDTTLVFDAS